MKDMRPVWQKTYEEGLKAGYSITDINDYRAVGKRYEDGEMKEIRQPESQVRMSGAYDLQTPFFTGDGRPVEGYGIVELSNRHDGPLRDYNTMEFWVNGKNMEDLPETDRGIYDADGKPLDRQEKLDEMGRFIAAASEYPHAMKYAEWAENVEHRNRLTLEQTGGKIDLGEPDADGYMKYLSESVEPALLRRDVTYAGPVQSVSAMSDLYLSEPSTQEWLNECIDASEYDDGPDT